MTTPTIDILHPTITGWLEHTPSTPVGRALHRHLKMLNGAQLPQHIGDVIATQGGVTYTRIRASDRPLDAWMGSDASRIDDDQVGAMLMSGGASVIFRHAFTGPLLFADPVSDWVARLKPEGTSDADLALHDHLLALFVEASGDFIDNVGSKMRVDDEMKVVNVGCGLVADRGDAYHQVLALSSDRGETSTTIYELVALAFDHGLARDVSIAA